MKPKNELLIAAALLTIAVAGRLLLLDYPNLETITAASLVAGAYLSRRFAVWIPLLAVAITDAFIGNDEIFLFTWSAWLAIGLVSLALRGTTRSRTFFTASATAMSLGTALFFYLYTNFGVWLLSGMYEPTAVGLVQSYIAGLPFLKLSIVGNLMTVPVAAFFSHRILERLHVRESFKEDVWQTKPASMD